MSKESVDYQLVSDYVVPRRDACWMDSSLTGNSRVFKHPLYLLCCVHELAYWENRDVRNYNFFCLLPSKRAPCNLALSRTRERERGIYTNVHIRVGGGGREIEREREREGERERERGRERECYSYVVNSVEVGLYSICFHGNICRLHLPLFLIS